MIGELKISNNSDFTINSFWGYHYAPLPKRGDTMKIQILLLFVALIAAYGRTGYGNSNALMDPEQMNRSYRPVTPEPQNIESSYILLVTCTSSELDSFSVTIPYTTTDSVDTSITLTEYYLNAAVDEVLYRPSQQWNQDFPPYHCSFDTSHSLSPAPSVQQIKAIPAIRVISGNSVLKNDITIHQNSSTTFNDTTKRGAVYVRKKYKGELTTDKILKGKQYILFAKYSTRYQSFEGEWNFGFISINEKKDVVQFIQKINNR